MVKPEDVTPYDKEAEAWISSKEAMIDDMLKRQPAWTTTYNSHSECWAEIVRRYAIAGWHVRVFPKIGEGRITIEHPRWAFPDELIGTPR